jgi:hypothetical protein
MFRSLLRPSLGQHLSVKGLISAHNILCDPISLQGNRKNNYKMYLRLKYCITGCSVSWLYGVLTLNRIGIFCFTVF